MERRILVPRVTPGANIYLTGMMGSGKTTLGKLLAGELKRPFADADERIEVHANCSIAEIFRARGETHFRDLETATLLEFSRERGWIVSLGGGAVVREVNRRAIQAGGYSIYLKVRPEIALARLPEHPARPLLEGMSLQEQLYALERLLAARELYYLKADLVIENDGAPEGALEKILRELQRAGLAR